MAVFEGAIYCPECGAPVKLTAGLSSSGVRRDGKQLRASVTDATAEHRCPKGSS